MINNEGMKIIFLIIKLVCVTAPLQSIILISEVNVQLKRQTKRGGINSKWRPTLDLPLRHMTLSEHYIYMY